MKLIDLVGYVLWVAVLASAIWVYWDASKHRIGRVEGHGQLFNMSAGSWSFAVLFLWVVGFPIYLAKRKELISRASEFPKDPKPALGYTMLCIISLAVIIGVAADFDARNDLTLEDISGVWVDSNNTKMTIRVDKSKFSLALDVQEIPASLVSYDEENNISTIRVDVDGSKAQWSIRQVRDKSLSI